MAKLTLPLVRYNSSRLHVPGRGRCHQPPDNVEWQQASLIGLAFYVPWLTESVVVLSSLMS